MYTYHATINRIIDGDTVDVTLDLGFGVKYDQRVRLAGIDTPEKRTRNAAEKALGIDATNWLTKQLEGLSKVIIKTELDGAIGKYGRVLGWLYISDDAPKSLNSQMVDEGYAWIYGGGSKATKNLEELISIRKANKTLVQGHSMGSTTTTKKRKVSAPVMEKRFVRQRGPTKKDFLQNIFMKMLDAKFLIPV